VLFNADSAFVRVKPERRDVSYPVSTTSGPRLAPSSGVRRETLLDESIARHLPRRTAALPVTRDTVRPTPVGQVFIF